MYVMLNCYYLTDAERKAIFDKARKNGNRGVAVRPGFICRTPTRYGRREYRKYSGMNIVMEAKTAFPISTSTQVTRR